MDEDEINLTDTSCDAILSTGRDDILEELSNMDGWSNYQLERSREREI